MSALLQSVIGSLGGGGAFSPLDLDNLVLFFDPAESNMWQDTARTTPVTATGQPVASVQSLVGSGIYATSTVSPLPTLEEDANGLHLAGGVDSIINMEADYTGSGFVVGQTSFSAFRRGGTVFSAIIGMLIDANGANFLSFVAQSSERTQARRSIPLHASVTPPDWGLSAVGSDPIGKAFSIVMISPPSDVAVTCRVNGTDRPGGTIAAADMTATYPLGSSTRLRVAQDKASKQYAWGMCTSAPDTEQIESLETWLAARCGAILA